MDWSQLALAVVAILAPYFKTAGEALAKRIGEAVWEGAKRLSESVKERFADDEKAESTLHDFEETPERHQRALADVLREKLEADPAFAQRIQALLANQVLQEITPVAISYNEIALIYAVRGEYEIASAWHEKTFKVSTALHALTTFDYVTRESREIPVDLRSRVDHLGEPTGYLRDINPYHYTGLRELPRFQWDLDEVKDVSYEVAVFDQTKEIWREIVAGVTSVRYPSDNAPTLIPGKKYNWQVDAIRDGEQVDYETGVFWLLHPSELDIVAEQEEVSREMHVLDRNYVLATTYFHAGLYEDAIRAFEQIIEGDYPPAEKMVAHKGLAEIYEKLYTELNHLEYFSKADICLDEAQRHYMAVDHLRSAES